MNYAELREKYQQRAIKFAEEWKEEVSDHIIDVIVSVMFTRDKIQEGGSFVQSVCNNDLYQAVSRADSDCIKHLKLITLAKYNCHI
jgi:hypothetical protein